MVNQSKVNDPRFWKKWRDSGAVGTIKTTYSGESDMYQKMVELSPDKNPIFTGIAHLTEPREMQGFIDSCVAHYRQHGDSPEVRANPESVVKQNIGYVVGSHSQETAKRWMDTIDGVTHPIFGKNIPFNEPKKAYAVAGRR